ncbi:MAG: hypothetical protein BRD44_02980 [Bacteroidetes bacterium QS_7_67_15]|nr:MAG: hypothetical protein BRD44_02980 [Bacteroidetes bacterium QS_7_67_15]
MASMSDFAFYSTSAPPLPRALALLLAVLLAACGGGERSASSPQALDASAETTSTSGRASGQAAGASARPAPGDTASAAASTSELHVNRTETFYTVTGRTEQALLRDLVQHGPRSDGARHFGRTSWTARWEIVYEQASRPAREAPCRIRRADVYLDVEVTMPRWNAPSNAPAALRRDWSSFLDALAFHEREHQESIISAGRRVARALEDLTATSCSALEEKADTQARSIIEEARRYNRRFDERTRHGRTQGARWPQ